MTVLQVEAVLDVPLHEVSGICAFVAADGRPTLAAMGDASSTLAWAIVEGGAVADWQHTDLADLAGDAIPRKDTQAEAVAADGAGHFLVLLEEPSRVVAFDVPQRSLRTVIELVLPASNPVAEAWARDPNSRGEGLVLLANGHLLVVKEKHPPALLEFGPPGDAPGGLGRDRLVGPGGRWTPPTAPAITYEALATWLLVDELADQLGDVSDAAAGSDGCLYLLSDQSSHIARLAPITADGPVEATAVFSIDGKPDKAEGLALLPDGRAWVALDTKKAKENLLVLGPPIVAT